jgi:hypothetical protein
MTTPLKSTLAPLHHLLDGDGVAPPATHDVTPIDPEGRHITSSTLGSRDPVPWILFTKIWRILVKDEVLLGRGFVVRIVRLQLEFVSRSATSSDVPEAPCVAHEYTWCPIKSVLNRVAHFPEMRKSHPTCFHRARARHPVTLAVSPHQGLNMLQSKEIEVHL